MNYQEVLDFLYTQLPMYQRVGKVAFKKDLTNTLRLAEVLNNPHQRFKSIHVAGTNGKGSTSHLIASVLQSAGYKVGLYTSPHLRSFRERIRVNGEEITESFISEFVNKHQSAIEKIAPSFFEITVVMAYAYFAEREVDFAVVETGLGGRLDSTNIITPELSVITSISLDHQDMLGHTIEEIAREKAGIIKDGVPVVVGHLPPEALHEIKLVVVQKQSVLDEPVVGQVPDMPSDLSLPVLRLNLGTVSRAIDQLRSRGIQVDESAFASGVNHVVAQTGLKGRWQTLRSVPRVICDVGHNEEAVVWLMEQVATIDYEKLHIVWGAVADKSLDKIFPLLIKECEYYFCAAHVPRAMSAEVLAEQAVNYGLKGQVYGSVDEAYHAALANANPKDLVFIGGSTFVVAELNDL
ncbi:bifunctional folylpolyglutamate synthase/dihydrofolate synthase [Reichenbachiella carrageenanivorans]|uniref:Dihydrofolate synthase/folylpolyglutamate synthase n=1 Tax=Reichenbachiella carrageenanivorans TaxID=2979869 RepID=A0ABY6D2J0_9BACT|nr:folylpolyglutamate synthase/dihydrofolate synthase family protein [Reichenbachiella carrageenanivorans]UXX79288.1 bifunctional folylpolyglutamate synthase/dihydrofolate synthase [Reichenbachiella carrageenanivorans]